MTQVTKKEKQPKKRRAFPFVFVSRLTRNSIFLILLICVLLFILYLIGNFQNFIDKSQLRILAVLSGGAVALCIMSVLGVIEEIVFIFLKEKKAGSFFSIVFFVFTFAAGFAMTAFSTVVRRIAIGV